MERIGKQVAGELARFGPAGAIAEVVAAWPAAVGDEIARNAWPARIARDGTLHVHTSSSAWAFELKHLERTVAERLREALSGSAPPRMRFAPGPLPEGSAGSVKEVEKPPREPSAEERSEGRRIAAPIADESLREAVAKAAAASLARAADDRSVC